jgi:hypothetical protein
MRLTQGKKAEPQTAGIPGPLKAARRRYSRRDARSGRLMRSAPGFAFGGQPERERALRKHDRRGLRRRSGPGQIVDYEKGAPKVMGADSLGTAVAP